jgi:glycine/D-amino acid oxidase-like deaminating enzyme
LARPISGGCYVADIRPGRLIAGATYEHSWATEAPDLFACETLIRKKVAQFSPEFAALPLIRCTAGFRATTIDKKPFIYQSDIKTWCLGGLGSKGLLYHAWLAKSLTFS